MVKGMDQFREHFRGLEDRYVLIGGAACDLLMEEAGLDFRATKDLDIVLCGGSISDDLNRFLEAVEADPPDTLKPFGLGAMGVADMVEKLRSVYGLSG